MQMTSLSTETAIAFREIAVGVKDSRLRNSG